MLNQILPPDCGFAKRFRLTLLYHSNDAYVEAFFKHINVRTMTACHCTLIISNFHNVFIIVCDFDIKENQDKKLIALYFRNVQIVNSLIVRLHYKLSRIGQDG